MQAELQEQAPPQPQQQPQPPSQQQQQRGQQQRQLVLSSCTIVHIRMYQSMPAAAGVAAAYCTALWRALPSLQRLVLSWRTDLDLLPQLPPLTGFQGLTSLVLDSYRYVERKRVYQLVQAPVLMRLLQGATQLQHLALDLDVGYQDSSVEDINDDSSESGGGGDGSSTSSSSGSDDNYTNRDGSSGSGDSSRDRLVLELQRALPVLTWLRQGGGEPLAAATVAALRPGLKLVSRW